MQRSIGKKTPHLSLVKVAPFWGGTRQNSYLLISRKGIDFMGYRVYQLMINLASCLDKDRHC